MLATMSFSVNKHIKYFRRQDSVLHVSECPIQVEYLSDTEILGLYSANLEQEWYRTSMRLATLDPGNYCASLKGRHVILIFPSLGWPSEVTFLAIG